MPVRIHIHDGVIVAIGIQIEAQRVGCIHISPSVLLDKPSNCGIVIPCAEIVVLRFRVKIFAAVEEWVFACPDLLRDIPKRIISIAYHNGVVLHQLYHIAVRIVYINLAVRVMRAVQAVVIKRSFRAAEVVLVYDVHPIVYKVHRLTPDRFSHSQSIAAVRIHRVHIAVGITILLPKDIVRVTFVARRQHIPVFVVGVRGRFTACRFGQQPVVRVIG